MPDLNLEAVKARLAAATPGPWRASGSHGYSTLDGSRVQDRRGYILAVAIGDVPELAPEANAAFIAHAPTDIADLVAEVERQTEEVRQQKILIGWLANIARKPRVSDEEMARAMKAVELALGEPK